MVALNGRHFANSRELCELRVINWQFNVHCYAFICCLNKNQKGYISFAVIVLSRIWFLLYDVWCVLKGSISCIRAITSRFNMKFYYLAKDSGQTKYLYHKYLWHIYSIKMSGSYIPSFVDIWWLISVDWDAYVHHAGIRDPLNRDWARSLIRRRNECGPGEQLQIFGTELAVPKNDYHH